jgi:hypothetical protein
VEFRQGIASATGQAVNPASASTLTRRATAMMAG